MAAAATAKPSPYTVVIDNREQRPFLFVGELKSGKDVYRVEQAPGTLQSGDYSLRGYELDIAVERKSLTDLFCTLGKDRPRFERELQRLEKMSFAAIVVEADWRTVLTAPPPRSKLRPETIVHSVLAWQQRYQNIHWWFCMDRDMAEIVTLRILDRFWRDSKRLFEVDPAETIKVC